jgi:uncharacterized membrane protein YphA (DoxX/SURF4 family)
MHTIAVGCAVVVGAVFVFASVAKLLGMKLWREDSSALGIPHYLIWIVPVYELVIGVCLIVGIATVAIAVVAALTLAAMSILLLKNLVKENPPRCSCFGKFSRREISANDVARNLALIALSVIAAVAF